MTDSRGAVGFDRLPWLDDEPERVARRSSRGIAGWAVAGVLLIAGASYWLGQRSASEAPPPAIIHSAPQSTTVPLPVPQPAQPQVQPDQMPDVEPAPTRVVTVTRPSARSVSRNRPTVTIHRGATPPQQEPKPIGSEATAAKAPAAAQPEQTLRLLAPGGAHGAR